MLIESMIKKIVLIMIVTLFFSSLSTIVSSEGLTETYIFQPTGNIVIGWGPGTGSGYTEVDDVTPDDTITYVGTSFDGTVDAYSFTPEYLSEILNVTIYGSFITDFIGSRFCLVLYQKSTEYYISSPPIQLSKSGEWVTISYTWEVNPFTGQNWTYEDIIDLGIGICADYCDRGSAVFCTQVYLEIGAYIPDIPDDGTDGETGTKDDDESSNNAGPEGLPEIVDIDDLIEILGLINLNKEVENSFISKLENTKKSIEKGNINAALNQLNAFIKEVETKTGKIISTKDSEDLILYTELVISYL